MTAVADIFDRDGDGYIDYYEFVAALHPNKDAYRPTTDADKIEDEVRDLRGGETAEVEGKQGVTPDICPFPGDPAGRPV